jgi:hypothetical protein
MVSRDKSGHDRLDWTATENGMSKPRKVHIKSFGCQMNVYDSHRMADTLAPEGFAETASPEDADLVILNTCHIREKAVEKVYSEIGRIREMKEAAARDGRSMTIAVAGCVAQAEGKEIIRRALAELPPSAGDDCTCATWRQSRRHGISDRGQVRGTG